MLDLRGMYFNLASRRAFETGPCENCGTETLEPNALQLPETTVEDARRYGMTVTDLDPRTLPEIYFHETLGICICDSCAGDVEDEN